MQNDNKISEPLIRFALIFYINKFALCRGHGSTKLRLPTIAPLIIHRIFSFRAVGDANPYALAQFTIWVCPTQKTGELSSPLQICHSGCKTLIVHKPISGFGPCGRAPRPCYSACQLLRYFSCSSVSSSMSSSQNFSLRNATSLSISSGTFITLSVSLSLFFTR